MTWQAGWQAGWQPDTQTARRGGDGFIGQEEGGKWQAVKAQRSVVLKMMNVPARAAMAAQWGEET